MTQFRRNTPEPASKVVYLPVDMRDFTESKEGAIATAKAMPGADQGYITVLCFHPGCFDDYLLNAIPDEPVDAI